jgi:hypothetical protein
MTRRRRRCFFIHFFVLNLNDFFYQIFNLFGLNKNSFNSLLMTCTSHPSRRCLLFREDAVSVCRCGAVVIDSIFDIGPQSAICTRARHTRRNENY